MALLTAMLRARTGRARAGLARGCAALAALVWLWAAAPAAAVESPAPAAEYQVKAAFLFNFAQFVEWPDAAFAGPQAPLVIGVIGDDPFGPYLDELVKSEKIGERPLVVRRYRRPQDITECHILFVSRAQAAHFDRLAPDLKGRCLLTVGDTDNFNRLGGMVRFVTEGGKIRLRINAESAKGCGLTISSKLLRWATIVTQEKG